MDSKQDGEIETSDYVLYSTKTALLIHGIQPKQSKSVICKPWPKEASQFPNQIAPIKLEIVEKSTKNIKTGEETNQLYLHFKGLASKNYSEKSRFSKILKENTNYLHFARYKNDTNGNPDTIEQASDSMRYFQLQFPIPGTNNKKMATLGLGFNKADREDAIDFISILERWDRKQADLKSMKNSNIDDDWSFDDNTNNNSNKNDNNDDDSKFTKEKEKEKEIDTSFLSLSLAPPPSGDNNSKNNGENSENKKKSEKKKKKKKKKEKEKRMKTEVEKTDTNNKSISNINLSDKNNINGGDVNDDDWGDFDTFTSNDGQNNDGNNAFQAANVNTNGNNDDDDWGDFS